MVGASGRGTIGRRVRWVPRGGEDRTQRIVAFVTGVFEQARRARAKHHLTPPLPREQGGILDLEPIGELGWPGPCEALDDPSRPGEPQILRHPGGPGAQTRRVHHERRPVPPPNRLPRPRSRLSVIRLDAQADDADVVVLFGEDRDVVRGLHDLDQVGVRCVEDRRVGACGREASLVRRSVLDVGAWIERRRIARQRGSRAGTPGNLPVRGIDDPGRADLAIDPRQAGTSVVIFRLWLADVAGRAGQESLEGAPRLFIGFGQRRRHDQGGERGRSLKSGVPGVGPDALERRRLGPAGGGPGRPGQREEPRQDCGSGWRGGLQP